MGVTIRRAALTDVETLVRFNLAMAKETEEKELSSAVLARGIRSVFEDPGKGFYLVAEADGMPVGSLLVTYEWSDWRNAYCWWIQSVYVLPERRRMGVYRRLHRHVENLALSAGNVCGLRLYVDGGNSTAKAVYARLGMLKSRYDLFESSGFTSTDNHDDD